MKKVSTWVFLVLSCATVLGMGYWIDTLPIGTTGQNLIFCLMILIFFGLVNGWISHHPQDFLAVRQDEIKKPQGQRETRKVDHDDPENT